MPASGCPERDEPGRAARPRCAPVARPAPLSFGLVEGRPVFMDERDDIYFMLEPEDEAEFLESLRTRRGSDPGHPAAAGKDGPELFAGVHTQCTRPGETLLDRVAGSGGARLRDIASLAPLLVSLRRALRRGKLSPLLAAVRSRAASNREADGSCPVERSLRFAAARRLVPVSANCLLDSLALLHFLGPAARTASLVFGVKLDPFAAHCWVQTADLLLNDREEHVSRFVPVRTVSCSPATR